MRRSFKDNVASLAAAQAATYLVPLFAIPHLVSTLGPNGYGRLAFAQALSVLLILLTDYGFNYAGARSVAGGEDRREIARIFWEIQATKLILATSGAVLLFASASISSSLGDLGLLLPILLLEPLGSLLVPAWMLLGMGKMRELALLGLLTRSLSLVGILLFVRSNQDVNTAAALLFGAAPLGGAICTVWLAATGGVSWARPTMGRIRAQLVDGWHPFTAAAGNAVNRSGCSVVLGLVSGAVAVGHYSLAEKLVRLAQEVIRPLTHAAFPRIGALSKRSLAEARQFHRQVGAGIILLSFAATVALFVLAPTIGRFLGTDSNQFVSVVRVMSAIPLISGINNVLGVQGLLAFGHGPQYSRRVMVAAGCALLFLYPLIAIGGDVGAALSYVLSELLLCFLFASFFLGSQRLTEISDVA